MTNKKLTDLTTLTSPADGDLLLITDISEALAINKSKGITVANLINLAAQSAVQALVTGQTAGDIFLAATATALGRLAKGAAKRALLMNAGATAFEWKGGSGCHVTRRTNQNLADDSEIAVSFTTEKRDTDSYITPTSSIFTMPFDGWYLMTAAVEFAGGSSSGIRRVMFDVISGSDDNGWRAPQKLSAVDNDTKQLATYWMCKISAGGTLAVRVQQNSGGALNLINAECSVAFIAAA